jgi:phosphinothricin acetyltransferase
MQLRGLRSTDSSQIQAIYNYEVLNTLATLDLTPRDGALQDAWMVEHSGIHTAVVCAEDDHVLGYASISPFRLRAGYSTSVENSIYVHRDARRRGIGRLLLNEITRIASVHGFHTCIARVVATQAPSIELHKACGFQLIGVEREVGRKFGQWIDIALLQKML